MPRNRALLLDRDGVINIDHGYVGMIDRFDFMPGLFPFLRVAQDKGFRLAIATNQSGVARGMFSAADHEKLNGHMQNTLRREGIEIALILSCFDHPEGSVASYKRESFWRKPNPGMVLEAMRRLTADPARSAFLGDNLRDMQAAQAGGIGKCLWLTQGKAPQDIIPVKNFEQALKALIA